MSETSASVCVCVGVSVSVSAWVSARYPVAFLQCISHAEGAVQAPG